MVTQAACVGRYKKTIYYTVKWVDNYTEMWERYGTLLNPSSTTGNGCTMMERCKYSTNQAQVVITGKVAPVTSQSLNGDNISRPTHGKLNSTFPAIRGTHPASRPMD